jgi:hypothetical protein
MPSDNAKVTLVPLVELAIESSVGEATAKVSLRAADIDKLIVRLAGLRATMTPEVPRVVSDSTPISKVADPMWILHAPAEVKDKVFAVRHPGLGWLVAELPASEAARLGHALLSGEASHPEVERPANRRLH